MKLLTTIFAFNAIAVLGSTVISNEIPTDSNDNRKINKKNNNKYDKCSKLYFCPPNFLRINQNCYYFSMESAPWQEAFQKCKDLKGTLAMIRNINQDNNIKGLLKKVPLVKEERWIGGLYDWLNMKWVWGKNGKEIKYLGFDQSHIQDKDRLQYTCITLDPEYEYKWNSRICTDRKHFVCQTKISKISKQEMEKFVKKFNGDKQKKLNEVLAPALDGSYPAELRSRRNQAAFAYRNGTLVERRRNLKKNKKNKKQKRCPVYYNGTLYQVPLTKYGRKKRKNLVSPPSSAENLKTVVYYGNVPKSPLQPRILTEEHHLN